MTQPDPIWRDAPKTPEYTGVDRATFERDIAPLNQPAILRGLVADWPAAKRGAQGPDALCDYLLRFSNTAPVQAWFGDAAMAGRYHYGPDLKAFNFDKRQLPFAELIDLLRRSPHDPAIPPVFAGAIPMPQALPGLVAETPMPLLDPAMERLQSLWIGNGSRTAAHWDLAQNLACVIAGPRTFVMFPPDQLPNLYCGPIDHTLAGQPISLVDFDSPDFDAHPRFREALAHAQVAELAPGDALHIPSLWWHYVVSPKRFGAQINFWWREGPEWMATPLYTLFLALLTLREMPAAEREGWRGLFDHYIFSGGADSVAHIPEAARGVLGEMTPELMQRMRAFLAGTLR